MTIIDEPTVVNKIKPKIEVKEPAKWNVIFLNDDVTTQEFVIEILIIIFNYSTDDADLMTQKIHNDGSGIVATLPFEMAEQKGLEVTVMARNSGFPLMVKLEPEA
jgi:ATP-dependent Clp protease adaptor protein ClpS